MYNNKFETLSREEQKELISKIRNETGMGTYEIKKTLKETNCDYNLTIEALKEKAFKGI